MKSIPMNHPRLRRHVLDGMRGDERNGIGWLTLRNRTVVRVLFSDGEGWEHVSVSLPDRCPTWAEMCEVRDFFWPADVWVVQYHPPKSEYVNAHPYCLHLWRPIGQEMPTPPSWMVGPRVGDAA
jgi:hypothetical protein